MTTETTEPCEFGNLKDGYYGHMRTCTNCYKQIKYQTKKGSRIPSIVGRKWSDARKEYTTREVIVEVLDADVTQREVREKLRIKP